MIKILVGALTSEYGGIESLFYNIAQNIDKSKFHLDFLCIEEYAARAEEFEACGSKIHYLHIPRKNFVAYMKDLDEIFSKNKYDIYHLNLTRYKPFADIKIAKKYGTRVIIHSHLTGINKPPGIVETCLRYFEFYFCKPFALYLSDYLVACSSDAAGYLFNNRKCQIIYNGIEYEKFEFSLEGRRKIRNEFMLPDSTILVGNVGRLAMQKNHPYLLKIMFELNKISDDFRLLLVGGGEEEGVLKNLVKEMNIQEKVIFTGFRKDINDMLSAMDLFLLPSIREALPIALIEAQVNGLWCLISDNITTEVDIGNVARMSTSVKPEIWAENIYKNLCDKRIERVKVCNQKFNNMKFIQEIERLYSRLVY